MCNIAGYAGNKPAAPILIEMMLAEEGIQGGYYSGIATVHEGKIYYAKVVGDMKKLLEETDAANMPGTVGIIHSRSKSGGGIEWGHPFISERDGVIKSAYVGNGGQGYFLPFRSKLERRAEELLGLGYTLRSRDKFSTKYPTLSDGTCVHMSDIMSQEIQYFIDNGMSASDAMEAAFHSIPGELAGLTLSLSEPDSIAWSRSNMPMFVGRASHGMYLASTALAFPSDAKEETLLPPQASGTVFADHYTVKTYAEKIANMGFIDDAKTAEAYGIICSLLEEGDKRCSDLYKAVYPLFDGYDYFDSEPLTYSIMQTLARAGKLEWKNVTVPGAFEGLTAPQTRYWLKK